MKKLSDYQGDDAIELWADLLDPLTTILTTESVREVVQSGKPRFLIAKEILQSCKKEAVQIMERIDPEPVNGLNIITRLVALLAEIGQNEEIRSFFGYAVQAKAPGESSGSATESIGAEEK